MTSPLAAYLVGRIQEIQIKHNFDPQTGAEQINGRPTLVAVYSEFSTLRTVAKLAQVELEIPWDPLGLNEGVPHKSEPDASVVYFVLADEPVVNGLSIWKIGHTKNMTRRLGEVQTGNHRTLATRITVPGGFLLESRFKHYYRKYKTRARNKSHKGEWIAINSDQLRADLARFREVGEAIFFGGPSPSKREPFPSK